MENSVQSLFTWAPNSKKTGRFLCFEFKAGLFPSLASEEEGAEQSHWWRFKVLPQNCLQLQRQVRFRYHEACVLWEYHQGVGAAPWRHQQGAEQPTKGVQGHITLRDLKGKTCGRKKMTTSEKQAHTTVYQIEKLLSLSSLGKLLQILTENRYQKQRSRKGSGFCWWWFGFSQQRQEGSKALIPG